MIIRFDESLREYFPEQMEVEASTPLDALQIIAMAHPLNGKLSSPIPAKFVETDSYELLTNRGMRNETFTLTRDNPKPYDASKPRPYQGSGGGKSGSWLQIIVGVALIIIGIVLQFVPGAEGVGAYFISAGASIVVGGIIGLLAPKPKDSTSGRSYSFSGAGVTTTQSGTPIQLAFGKILVGGQLLSFNIATRNYSGVDDPDNSAWFNGKANTDLPDVNIGKFYGVVQAGTNTRVLQVDNNSNRTGTEF